MPESRVKCPSCGSFEVPGGASCSACGGPLRGSVHYLVELSDERACPHCAETIKAAATVCRFCGKDVTPGRQQWRRVETAPHLQQQRSRSVWGPIITILGSLMLVYFFALFDTSVALPDRDGQEAGRRVNNIGLMNDRQNGILVGGVLLIAGIVLSARGRRP